MSTPLQNFLFARSLEQMPWNLLVFGDHLQLATPKDNLLSNYLHKETSYYSRKHAAGGNGPGKKLLLYRGRYEQQQEEGPTTLITRVVAGVVSFVERSRAPNSNDRRTVGDSV